MSYESAHFTLRAPRVAVVFDGGDDWRFWALTAMRDVTHTWGGAGFVLVPHKNGVVNPTLAEAVRAYDPDFVVPAQRRFRHFEAVHPGAIRSMVTDCSEEQAAELLRTSGDHIPQDAQAHHAAEWLAAWCSPYLRREGESRDYGPFALASTTSLPSTAVTFDGSPRLAVPATWRGPVALAAAVAFGVIDEPTADTIELDDDDVADVLAHSWGVNLFRGLPAELVHSASGLDLEFDTARMPRALDTTQAGLTLVGRSHPLPHRFRYVVGDSAEDFSLAMILHRISANTFWMHPDWLPGSETKVARVVEEATSTWFHAPSTRWTSLSILSTSRTAEQLQPWADVLRGPGRRTWELDGGTLRPPANEIRQVSTGGPWLDQERNLHLAASDQFDQQIPLPVVTSADSSVTIAATLPLPSTTTGQTTMLPYQVDLGLDDPLFPTGRGFDGHVMLVRDDWHTWVRSARDAVSYQAHRFDFVAAGATNHGQLATPQLRLPSLRTWVDQMARQAGYEVSLSEAGRKSELLAVLWGGRKTMTAALDGPLREVLRHLAAPPKGQKDSYMNGQAVRLDAKRGVMTFHGVHACWPEGTKEETVRDLIDELTVNGILRRGLLLRCPGCTRLDFIALDDLGQLSRCTRCLADIPLVRSSWRMPAAEPKWFYDAHPLASSLLTSHSDVPFLLANHLKRSTTRYADIGELEFTRDGASRVEIDLIALVEDRLVVAEAKSNSDLGSGTSLTKAIDKRLLVAEILRADEVVFATTEPQWRETVSSTVRNARDCYRWAEMRPVAARMISGLGGIVADRPA